MSKKGTTKNLLRTWADRLDELTPHWIARAQLVPNELEVAATLSTPCRRGIVLSAISANGTIAVAGEVTNNKQVLVLFAPGSREYKVIDEGKEFKRLFFPEGSDEPAYEVLRRNKRSKVQNFVHWTPRHKVQVTTYPGDKIRDLRFWEYNDYALCLVAIYNSKSFKQKIQVYRCYPHQPESLIRTYGDNDWQYAVCLGIYAGQELIKLATSISPSGNPCQLIHGDWESDGWYDDFSEHLIARTKKDKPIFVGRPAEDEHTSLLCQPGLELPLEHICWPIAAGQDRIYWQRENKAVIQASDGSFFVWPEKWKKAGNRQLFLFENCLVIYKKLDIGSHALVSYALDGTINRRFLFEKSACLYGLRQVGNKLVFRDDKNHLSLIEDLNVAHEPDKAYGMRKKIKPNFFMLTRFLVALNDGSILALKALSEGSIALVEVYRP